MLTNCAWSNLLADVDECDEGSDGCAQMCTNTIGSYSCSCRSGYRLASDSHGCTDIDECAEERDGCNQTCTNTLGSYSCSCGTGYRLERQLVCSGKSVHQQSSCKIN